jgi:hypothetical protein
MPRIDTMKASVSKKSSFGLHLAALYSRFQVPILVIVLCAMAVLLMGNRMLLAWAGDAVIHLRVAELFAQGRGFQFNLGEPVLATTSLMWTFLLAFFFSLLSPGNVANAVKVMGVLLWVLTVFMTATAWGRLYRNRWVGLASAAFFALNPGVFQNSVNGMDAILLAMGCVTLFFVHMQPSQLSTRQVLALSALAIVVALTRPEGILFCLLLGAYDFWLERRLSLKALAPLAGAGVGVAVTVLLSWSINGTLLPDSGTARMAAGLRESIWLGPVHLHPDSATLLAAYWPLALGVLVQGYFIVRQDRTPLPGISTSETATLRSALTFSLLLIGVMFFLYTFVLGATHTIRYWLPFFPFVVGVAGGAVLRVRQVRAIPVRVPAALVGVCCLWMAAIYVYEWTQRMDQSLGYTHEKIVNAVPDRPAFTTSYLQKLGITGVLASPVKLAVTEVQVRYFLSDDSNLEILSLDGRTTKDFKRFLNPRTGMRRFDKYLTELKPDYIKLGPLYPQEPILPDLRQRLKEEADPAQVIEVDGFRFLQVDGSTVRYLHDK